ncbi:Lrp/AsnC family transcriptional regulator [Synergistaceae bacterium OttesenSCG-928-I11]|nr:Lrp/AsnC family transcriptional regulator [Synergistaceae bacterium OttesenSCG-928-I11]
MSQRGRYELDETGWMILEELQENARISFKDLANKVKLSPTAVIERVRRMEEEGIITGYRAMVDPRKVGFTLSALINMSTNYGNPDDIIGEVIADIPEVVSCWSITGTSDFLLEVQVSTLEFLEELLTALSKHGKLTTSIVLPSSVRKRLVKQPRHGLSEA